MRKTDTFAEQYWTKKTRNKDTAGTVEGKTGSFEISIPENDVPYFYKLTNSNALSQFSVLSIIYYFLLDRYFDNFNGVITFLDGNRIRTTINNGTTTKSYIYNYITGTNTEE